MCKPPAKCRIEASHRRFYHGQKKSQPGRKRATGENPGAAADGKHRQHGRHPEPVQGDHRRVHGEWSGGGAGR